MFNMGIEIDINLVLTGLTTILLAMVKFDTSRFIKSIDDLHEKHNRLRSDFDLLKGEHNVMCCDNDKS